MSAVPASKLLNAFLKDGLAPVLLGVGFKATGRTYRRAVGDALQVVDIQNWKFNDAKRARFTLELGVCFPRLLAAVAALDAYAFYRENSARPGITECVVRRRIGEFMQPPEDVWWTVSATTGYVPPAGEVAKLLLDAGLPWLESMSTLASVAAGHAPDHALTNRVMLVAALFAQGQVDAGRQAALALAKARYAEGTEPHAALLLQLRSLEALGAPVVGGA